jgi:flagellar motor switch/type III secretory pathway protein FliN
MGLLAKRARWGKEASEALHYRERLIARNERRPVKKPILDAKIADIPQVFSQGMAMDPTGRVRFRRSRRILFVLEAESSHSPMSALKPLETDNPATWEFWKSLLRIQADVTVVLAQQPIAVDRVLHFVPGVMIQFDKDCESPLSLEIDGQKVAEGEVVKVGDKFGLRITEVCEHAESWIPLTTNPRTDKNSSAG